MTSGTLAPPRLWGEVLSVTFQRLQRAGIPNAEAEAKELVARAGGRDRKLLDLYRSEPWSTASDVLLQTHLLQRLNHVPLAYLLGEWDFLDMTLTVTPDVLIPRPETEDLFHWMARDGAFAGELVDVGTGAGGLALASARQWPAARVTAIDLSAAALAVARWNGRRQGVESRIAFRQADLLEKMAPRSMDKIVANLPYVATPDLEALMPEVLKEPRHALDGGPDGLSVIRRLVPQAFETLRAGGALYLEVGQGQAPAVEHVLTQTGFSEVAMGRDFAGIERFIRGIR